MALPKRKKSNEAKVDLSAPDEFVTVTQRAFTYAAENRKPLVVLLSVAGALIVTFTVAAEFAERRSATRANAFAKAVDIVSATVKPPAPEGEEASVDGVTPPADGAKPKPEERTFETASARAEAALVELSKVEGGGVGQLAGLGKATALLDTGKNAQAIEEYKRFIDSGVGDAYLFFGHDGLATALAESGDVPGAIAEVAKLAKLQGGAFADHASFRRGRLLEAKGDTADAIKAYKSLLEAHPTSLLKPQAEKRLGLLGG